MKTLWRIFIGIGIVILIGIGVANWLLAPIRTGEASWSFLNPAKFADDTLVLEVYDPRYACGDWVDDLRVVSCNNADYQDLVGNDIDPYLKGLSSLETADRVYEFIWADYLPDTIQPGHLLVKGIPYSEACGGCEAAVPFKLLSMEMKLSGRKMEL